MKIGEILEMLAQPEYSLHIIKFGKPDGYGFSGNCSFSVDIKYSNTNGDTLHVRRSHKDIETALSDAWIAINMGAIKGIATALPSPVIEVGENPSLTDTEPKIPF